ncbi:MAG: hypothetical protein C5B58_07885 [Acidobacteria bacterium]|nr:MAG: hypothetical protein C5B58_07885 [Acidobacteriota bacterium]
MTIALALIYISAIAFVGTILFAAVDWLEPNPRVAFIFKCALLGVGGAAIAHQLFRSAVSMGF